MAGSFLPPVVAVLAANTTAFTAGMLEAKGELGAVVESSSKLGTLGKVGLAGLAAAAGTVAVAAVHMGSEYQTQLTRLYTAAGAPKQAVLANSDAILSLASSVGQTGTAMAEALYHPISAGLDMATAMQVVKYAAQETTISGANLEDTTYSLSSVMKAFNLPAGQAQQTMSDLNAIVGQGDMRFQDFNESIKNWAPTAAQMGISINSMGAGLAYLTDRGNSAEVAATRMTMGISMMTTPSKQAATLLEGLGVASSDVKASSAAMTDVLQKSGVTQNKLAQDLKQPDGLYVALKDLQDGLKKAGVSGTEADSALAKIFGGGRSDKAIMSLMQNLDGLQTKFNDIAKSSTPKTFEQNWQDAQKTFGFQMQQIKAAAENALTHLGMTLLPKLSSFISDMGTKGKQAFANFMSGFNGNAGADTGPMAKLGAFIRPVVTDLETGAKDVAKAIGNVLSAVRPLATLVGGSFMLGVRAVAGLFANVLGPALSGVTGFLDRNKEIVTVLGGAYLTYKGIMLGIQIATKAWAVVQGILNAVMDANPIGLVVIAVAALALGVVELIKHWSQVSAFFKGLWSDVTHIFSDAVQAVSGFVGDIVNFVAGLAGRVVGGIADLAHTIQQGFLRIVTDALNFCGDLERDVVGFFTNTLPRAVMGAISWVGNVGKNIVEGIWNGIAGMGQWLWNQLVGWIKSVVPGPILSALGIGSPSKVMADQVGRWIPAGIAQGMLANSHVVSGASRTLAGMAVSGAGATGGYGGTTGGYGSAVGGGGLPGGVVVNVNVSGSLISTKAEIKNAVQQVFQQNGMRNVQSGLNFTLAGG